MLSKVVNRIRGWHLKFLSFGGRATLIRYVLLALNIHTLAVVHPLKALLTRLRNTSPDSSGLGLMREGKHHRVSWYNLCFPFKEGGANFRKLEDISLAFHAKQWWKFRTSNTMWSNFMKIKYADNIHPLTVNWAKGNSYNWKAMCDITERMDSNILWYVGRGNISFWFDTWSNIGPLYKKIDGGLTHQNLMLNEVLIDGQWDWCCLQVQLPEPIKRQVIHLQIILILENVDIPNCICPNTGSFSITTARNLLRQKRSTNQYDSKIWHNDIPFKMSFLAWRAVHNRLPTDDKINRFGINIPAFCSCCLNT